MFSKKISQEDNINSDKKKNSNLFVMLLPCSLKQGEKFKAKRNKKQRLIDYDNYTEKDSKASLPVPLGKYVFSFLKSWDIPST